MDRTAHGAKDDAKTIDGSPGLFEGFESGDHGELGNWTAAAEPRVGECRQSSSGRRHATTAQTVMAIQDGNGDRDIPGQRVSE
jgi:hypothetical protein